MGSNTSPSATREWCQRRVRLKGHRTRLNEVDEIFHEVDEIFQRRAMRMDGAVPRRKGRARTRVLAMYHHCTANLLERYYYRSTSSYKCHCIVQEFPFAAAQLFFHRFCFVVAQGWKVDAAGIARESHSEPHPSTLGLFRASGRSLRAARVSETSRRTSTRPGIPRRPQPLRSATPPPPTLH